MPCAWDILGLGAPTSDLRRIKKAYAKKLKITRPDDDPAAFMLLRDALDTAKTYAKYSLNAGAEFELPPPEINIARTKAAATPLEKIDSSEPPVDMQEIDVETVPNPAPAHAVLEEARSLLKHPFRRTNARQWSALIEDPRLEAIDDAGDFEDALRTYLLEQFGYFDEDERKYNRNQNPVLINSQIGLHLFQIMGWNQVLTRPLYVQDQIAWLKTDLGVDRRMRPLTNTARPVAPLPPAPKNTTLSIIGILVVTALVGNLIKILVETLGWA